LRLATNIRIVLWDLSACLMQPCIGFILQSGRKISSPRSDDPVER
jgi:hypothetical protein